MTLRSAILAVTICIAAAFGQPATTAAAKTSPASANTNWPPQPFPTGITTITVDSGYQKKSGKDSGATNVIVRRVTISGLDRFLDMFR